MRILYVITNGHWGGAQRYVYDLATHQPKNEIIVAVGESSLQNDLTQKLTQFIQQSGTAIKIIPLKYLVRPIHLTKDLLDIVELIRLYRKYKPDIIHLNSSKAGILGALAAIFFSKAQVVYTVHGWVFNEPGSKTKQKFYIWLEKITSYLKNTIIVLSPIDYKTGEKYLDLNSKKMTTIPLGIECPVSIEKSKAREIILAKTQAIDSAQKNWIGIIANLYQTKGLDILLEALSINPSTFNNTTFFVIGEGPERQKIAESITELRLEKIIYLTGAINNAEKLMKSFNLLVLPSRKEGLPYALLEAMHQHLPILATRVGGIPNLIENKISGLLCEAENPADLYSSLEFALSHPAELKLYADEAYKQVQNLSLKNLLQRTNEEYLKLLSRP